MSKQARNLEIDLNLIDQEQPMPTSDYRSPQGTQISYASPQFASGYMPGMDATAQVFGSPPYSSPAYVDASLMGFTPAYATPSYATPTFLTTGPAIFGTPEVYGTPQYGSIPIAETPAYNSAPSHRYKYRHQDKHMAVSCRVQNVVKRVRGFCLKNGIPLIKVVNGPNVLKISVRSVLHTQKLESALKKIVKTDGIQVEAVSLPESIDVTKRKRGFLLFMNLVNFEKDEQVVRQRFEDTGLDYKITVVDGLTHSQRPKPVKQGVATLMKEVELLKLEVSRLKESQSPPAEEKIALKTEQ